ncbi:Tyrosinase [Metarhizium robertsii ARSEF 23]|uniref:Tyrosinase n=1 Tax=Metarhizium robertsii (strain ARSEF 23 / ATCC MYA-3075) TaxID=655844 RepID=E9FE31_METRA|nr:Tyrosinase [Metarhizium robertsii ARSEF 23]EFY94007.1 Tyrosinase [Metarhizium robertsii ARSEF 23]
MAPHKYNLLRSPRPGESSDEEDKVGLAVSNDAELDVVKQSTSSRYCKDILPYWDWGLDWEDPTKSAIWDPVTGFGGDGDPEGPASVGWGSCVKDGPFADYEVLFYDFIPKLHCLSRGFGRYYKKPFPGDAFAPAAIQEVLDQLTFWNFTNAIELGPHDAIPNNICGDFFFLEAPNDPVFFLHHANLDRLWWTWQQKTQERIWEYNGLGNSSTFQSASLEDVLHMEGLGPDVKVRDVMHTNFGMFCYGY